MKDKEAQTRAESWIANPDKHLTPATNRGFLDGSVAALEDGEWVAYTREEWQAKWKAGSQ